MATAKKIPVRAAAKKSPVRKPPLVSVPSEPDVVTTRSYGAYLEIKRRILDLRMPPGTDFTEGELVADLGLSKTPIREALARLRQENLVDAVARSGYRVMPVTLKDARELLVLRTLLEGEAAALAATHGSDVSHLRELESLCRTSYNPKERTSIVAFLGANFEFHMAVARLSGNHRLAETLRGVLEQLERVMHLGLSLSSRADEIVHEHKELVAAIVSGDADGARRISVAQSRSSQVMVLNALLSSDAILATKLGGFGG
jgi:DNA-binding GntR family transcriptional regulator